MNFSQVKTICNSLQVMHVKESAASFCPPPAPASRKPMAGSVEQVNQPPITAATHPASSSNSVGNANFQEGEGMQLCYCALISISCNFVLLLVCLISYLYFSFNFLQPLMAIQSTLKACPRLQLLPYLLMSSRSLGLSRMEAFK